MAGRRSSIQRFEDLRVGQRGRELVKGIYRAAQTQALKHDRGLVDQMTSAAVSVTSNIAEGHERGSRAQYIEFCFYAKGSLGELRSQVINAHDVGLINEEAFHWLHDVCEEVSGLLANYIKHLSETSTKIPGMKRTRNIDRRWGSFHGWLESQGMRQLKNGRVVGVDSPEATAEAAEHVKEEQIEG